MLSPKARGRHSRFGITYYWGLASAFATATVLSVLRWQQDYPLFALACLAFGLVLMGRHAIRTGCRHLHIVFMGMSYVVLLTASYVDNGRNLPLWRDLPTFLYWTLPTVVGVPLIVRALVRNGVFRLGNSAGP